MNQRELAEKTGIRASSISKMCNNKAKHIPIETIDKICEILDCDVSELFARI
ncbi:XRE family transcriptional regulator [bacterium D16-51]|nr:XRE family transcriptional regulator [bacterium D16-59]RKI59306.1 XRE family transcriptional regulator [bacterium D16-51]